MSGNSPASLSKERTLSNRLAEHPGGSGGGKVFQQEAIVLRSADARQRLSPTDWTHSADYLEWTYRLRPNVRWHDGRPVTVDDVKFTIDLHSRPDSPVYDMRSECTVHDQSTSTVRGIGWTRGTEADSYVSIVPKHLLKDLDYQKWYEWDFWLRPVGNGPYRYLLHGVLTRSGARTTCGSTIAIRRSRTGLMDRRMLRQSPRQAVLASIARREWLLRDSSKVSAPSDRKERNAYFLAEEVEIASVRRHDAGTVSTGRESNQRVVLKRLSLVRVPTLGIADLSNQEPGLPPVGRGRRPLDSRQSEQCVHQVTCRRGSGAAAKLGKHDRRLTDDEGVAHGKQRFTVEPAFPVIDVHAGVDDGPAHATELLRFPA